MKRGPRLTVASSAPSSRRGVQTAAIASSPSKTPSPSVSATRGFSSPCAASQTPSRSTSSSPSSRPSPSVSATRGSVSSGPTVQSPFVSSSASGKPSPSASMSGDGAVHWVPASSRTQPASAPTPTSPIGVPTRLVDVETDEHPSAVKTLNATSSCALAVPDRCGSSFI